MGTEGHRLHPERRDQLRHLAAVNHLQPREVAPAKGQLAVKAGYELPSLEALGFEATNLLALGIQPGMSGASKLFADFKKRMAAYHERRDFPAVKGPSYLSVHLRFGTISIRALAAAAWHDAGRGAAGRRPLPMTAEELLESAMLIYLQGLGFPQKA